MPTEMPGKPPGLCTDLVAVSAAAEGGVRTSGKGFMEDRRLSRNVATGLASTEFILLFSEEGQKPGQGGWGARERLWQEIDTVLQKNVVRRALSS